MADDLPNSPAEDALEILLDDIQRRRDEVDVAQSQAWVDQLDAALDVIDKDGQLYGCVAACLRSLSRRKELLPSSCTFAETITLINRNRPLHQTARSDVYVGHLESGAQVALKTLRLHEEDRAVVEKSYRREIIAWRCLRHPNIVRFLGISSLFPVCSVSEWMINGSLVNFLHAHPAADHLKYGSDIVNGLLFMHSHNIVHGDLKGVNILVDEFENARLADFGLSELLQSTCTTHATGSLRGTLRWMAPELVSESGQLTMHSDIYALGMVFWELSAGCPPFGDLVGDWNIVFRVVSGLRPQRPEAGERFRLTHSNAIWSIMQQCWDRRTSARPTCAQIARTLRKHQAQYPSAPLSAELNFGPTTDIAQTDDVALEHSQNRSVSGSNKPDSTARKIEDSGCSTDAAQDMIVIKVADIDALVAPKQQRRSNSLEVPHTEDVTAAGFQPHDEPLPSRHNEAARLLPRVPPLKRTVMPWDHSQKHSTSLCAWNPVQPHLLAAWHSAAYSSRSTVASRSLNSDLSQVSAHKAMLQIWDVSQLPNEPGADLIPVTLEPTAFTTSYPPNCSPELTWSPDGRLLAVAMSTFGLQVFTDMGRPYCAYATFGGSVSAVRFSKDNKYLLVNLLHSLGAVVIFGLTEGTMPIVHSCSVDLCLDVDWIDERTFTTCNTQGSINVMRVGTITPLRTLKGHRRRINQVRFNEHNYQLASCSDDCTARVWDLIPKHPHDGTQASMIFRDAISTVQWCPHRYFGENWLLATCARDGTVRIWDTGTGACYFSLLTRGTGRTPTTFSPDGRFLAQAVQNGRVFIYDVMSKIHVWTWTETTRHRRRKKMATDITSICWQPREGSHSIALTFGWAEVYIIDAHHLYELQSA